VADSRKDLYLDIVIVTCVYEKGRISLEIDFDPGLKIRDWYLHFCGIGNGESSVTLHRHSLFSQVCADEGLVPRNLAMAAQPLREAAGAVFFFGILNTSLNRQNSISRLLSSLAIQRATREQRWCRVARACQRREWDRCKRGTRRLW
jgi:hypothetical protein